MNLEQITIQDCLDLCNLGLSVVIEDGQVTEILKKSPRNGNSVRAQEK